MTFAEYKARLLEANPKLESAASLTMTPKELFRLMELAFEEGAEQGRTESSSELFNQLFKR